MKQEGESAGYSSTAKKKLINQGRMACNRRRGGTVGSLHVAEAEDGLRSRTVLADWESVSWCLPKLIVPFATVDSIWACWLRRTCSRGRNSRLKPLGTRHCLHLAEQFASSWTRSESFLERIGIAQPCHPRSATCDPKKRASGTLAGCRLQKQCHRPRVEVWRWLS